MKQPSLFFPLLLIIVGGLWFLNSMDWFPATASIVAALFFIAGCLILLLDGINKQSVVSGPMLIYAGAAVYLHTQYWVGFSPLVALGMMVLGCMLLLSRSSIVPYKQNKQVKTDDGK